MKERSLSQRSYSNVLLYVLLFLFISFAIIQSLIVEKHLSADGAHYFTTILEKRDFTYIAWSRQFANYLTQWLVVIGVKLGLKDIPLLSKLYAIGLFFPYIASFALCIYAIRRENSLLLGFPLISIVGINLPGDYILIGEHHVMVLLSWPILLFSLRKEPLTWLDGWLLWTLLALFSRTYEAAAIPAIIFSTIFVVRLLQARQNKRQTVIYSISLLLSVLALAIALYYILNPRDPSNKSSFISEIVVLLKNKAALVAASFAFFWTIGLIYRKTSLILISLFPVIAYGCFLLLSSHGLTAGQSFASRTLSLSLLPFLLICAIVSSYFNIRLNRTSSRIFISFILIMVLGNLRFSGDWYNFRSQVVDIVTTNKGYIPIEETVIKDSPYRWSWNNPELGLIFSYPCVNAILLNSPNTKGEQFTPREKLILKDYIRYDDFFKYVDEDIKVCQ